MVIKMLTKLKSRMKALIENFNRDLENIRKNQSELKNIITKMKNTLGGFNSRLGDIEECICDLKEGIVEITKSDKIDFKIKNVTRDKEGYYIMIRGSIQEEDITIKIYMHPK